MEAGTKKKKNNQNRVPYIIKKEISLHSTTCCKVITSLYHFNTVYSAVFII